MPDYVPARRQAADGLQVEASDLVQEARTAADNASFYVRNTLCLTQALFFIGISRMLSAVKVRGGIQILAVLLLLFGALNALTGPMASGLRRC